MWLASARSAQQSLGAPYGTDGTAREQGEHHLVVEGHARVMDRMIMDGNIGASFLAKWNVTLNLADGRAWIAPAENRSE